MVDTLLHNRMGDVRVVTSTIEDAKAEVGKVLASATFARSQRMSRLLRYLCEKIFDGEADRIKEYSIAVDLLGRPTTFDPSEDAIARVEVHRLRKKLKEYYETEGNDRQLRIVIPPGSYVPTFVPGGTASVELASATAELPAPIRVETSVFSPDKGFRMGRWVLLGTIVVAALLTGFFFRPTKQTPQQSSESAGDHPSSGASVGGQPVGISTADPVRIGVGRTTAFRDAAGDLWGPDQFYSGGDIVHFPDQFIDATSNPEIFRAARTGSFRYDIPLGPGTWELRLYFVELQYGPGMPLGGGENSRVFHVIANNRRILSDFDLIADMAGPRVADVRVFKDITAGPEGRLRLNFVSRSAAAMICAVELTPARPHRLNPIRITARDASYKDSLGRIWARDNYARGGRVSPDHASPVQGTTEPEIFARERYGHFSYLIPVSVDGVYDVSLYFAETYWGSENPGGGGTGTRIFDVFCNGAALVRNLDIYSQVGANRAHEVKFRGLRPNMQSKLELSFVPVKDYATVFAISVDDVTP
ncbi:MAG: malectin domain-containing carbohydrate-binding protein [Bryobacteraceae bacterium]